jgi:hypothetical protein
VLSAALQLHDERYANIWSQLSTWYFRTLVSHSSQHSVDKVVHYVWLDQVLTFEHTHNEIWNNCEMLFETFRNYLTIFVVVFDRSNHRNSAEILKGLIVQFVH